MDHHRHARQGFTLLIVGVLLCAGILGTAVLLYGLGQMSRLGIVAATATISVPAGLFWRAHRYGQAWALLLIVLGGPLTAMTTILVMALISYAS